MLTFQQKCFSIYIFVDSGQNPSLTKPAFWLRFSDQKQKSVKLSLRGGEEDI